jgi:hypothetical protein
MFAYHNSQGRNRIWDCSRALQLAELQGSQEQHAEELGGMDEVVRRCKQAANEHEHK